MTQPRVPRCTLYASKAKDGLGILNVTKYDQAATISLLTALDNFQRNTANVQLAYVVFIRG